MTTKRETQIIIVGTISGLGIIVISYLWLQNYLFPPDMATSLKSFQKQIEQESARPFNKYYHASLYYFEKEKYDLALDEAKKALQEAELENNKGDIGVAHGRLLEIYLVMNDIVNAEKELDWRDDYIRQNGAWDKKVNTKETLGDIQVNYRHRLEELKKSQQKNNYNEKNK